MNELLAILLGFVEGATEFIPISSSGHLIIVREILGENNLGGLAFDAVLQLAASCAVLFYFRKDIGHIINNFFRIIRGHKVDNRDKVLLYSIILGTIPAVIVGLLLENQIETIFRNVDLVAIALILGSILFWYAQKVAKQNKELSLGRGIVIGFFQCLAFIPGVSRSGGTISGGLITGLTQEESVRFSFLLSIPILFGAGFKKLFDVRGELFTTDLGLPLLLGSITAFVVGLISIKFLIKYLKNHNLNVFIWYRIGLAITIFLFILLELPNLTNSFVGLQ